MTTALSSQAFQDHYQTLGVERTAPPAELKKAYLSLIRENPPERAPERFRSIAEAYRVLSHPERRKEYDSAPRFSQALAAVLQSAPLADDPKDRVRQLRAWRTRFPGELILEEWLAIALVNGEEPEEARPLLEALVLKKPDDATVVKWLGIALCDCGESAAGLRHLRQACVLAPTDNDAWFSLAVKLDEAGRFDDAIAALDRGIQADGKVDVGDLPLFMRKLFMFIGKNDWRNAEAVAQTLLSAVEYEDEATRKYVAANFAEVAQLAMKAERVDVLGFAVDALRRLDPDNENIKKFADEISQPARVQRLGVSPTTSGNSSAASGKARRTRLETGRSLRSSSRL